MDACNHKPLDEALTRASTGVPRKKINRQIQTCRYCGEKIILESPAELTCKRMLGHYWFATSFSAFMLFSDLRIPVGIFLSAVSSVASYCFLKHIGRYLHWKLVSENETKPMQVYNFKAVEEAQQRLDRDRYRG